MGLRITKNLTNTILSDGLLDGQEVNEHKTDPNVGDSDGDGSLDLIEVKAGTQGANQNVLRIDNVGHDDIGFYVVLVSNKFGTIYSKTVRLDLITKPGKPRLDIVFIDGKRITIEVTGDSLHTYEIQHSRDLKEWRPLAYNPLKTNDRGKTRLELNLSPESMHGFFRLIE